MQERSASTVNINAVTSADRLQTTARIREAIPAAGGWITGFQQFSNVSIAIALEIDARDMPRLLDALRAVPLRFDVCDERPGSDLIRATVQVTFVHSEGDLRRPVPAVPG